VSDGAKLCQVEASAHNKNLKSHLAILSALITSKTRLKLLLKLFSHPEAQGHLRGFAQEFEESTNSVRIELAKLHDAGLIVAQQDGQKVMYRPNIQNPFYRELCGLVSKHMGFDQLIERVLDQVGELIAAYVVGDYAKGLDTGTIEVAIVGEVDSEYLERLTRRAEEELGRKVKIIVYSDETSFRSKGHENILKLIGE
jgi:DNA-binding transcriptional ArsR family regulator